MQIDNQIASRRRRSGRANSNHIPDGTLSSETVAVWRAIPNGQGRGEFVTTRVLVPGEAEPGSAIYRATTFFTCNWLQRVLHWPIVQQGPDIRFTILP
jgi:hypothetical protein